MTDYETGVKVSTWHFSEVQRISEGVVCLNKEIKRRADVVGTFPNEDSNKRLIGAVLLEANYDWQLQHRYMQIEGMTELTTPMINQ